MTFLAIAPPEWFERAAPGGAPTVVSAADDSGGLGAAG
jgi:hypothetical protein